MTPASTFPAWSRTGTSRKTNFNRFLVQTARQSGSQTIPQPNSPQYKQIKDQAMQTALQIAWISGEASRQGITFTDTEVQQSLQQIKSQFKTQAEYVKARDQAGLTDADVLERAKLQLIQNKIQSKVQDSVGTVSTDDARKYYDANKSQFTQPAKRTIRIIQNKDAHQINLAYQALRTDDSAANWKKVAAQYSTDPTSKDKGGLRTDVVPGSFQQPLDDDIFKAPLHSIQGPVVTLHRQFRLRGGIGHAREGHGLRRDLRLDQRRPRRQAQRPDQAADQEPAAAGGAHRLRPALPRLLDESDPVRQ